MFDSHSLMMMSMRFTEYEFNIMLLERGKVENADKVFYL